MTEEEIESALDELRERIDGMEIDLTPPEESISTFSVFESDGAERQMIVHFIVAEQYGLSPPDSRSAAQQAFLKIIKEHKGNQNHSITHGDLMVLKGITCNYYCYVAKVDRYGGSGFQDEDETGAAISEEYEGRTVHELLIWTETYPGGGADAEFDVSSMTITSGTSGSLTMTELNLEPPPEEPEPEYIDSLKVTYYKDEEEGELYTFEVNNVKPGNKVIGTKVDAIMMSITIDPEEEVPDSEQYYHTSQAYFDTPSEPASNWGDEWTFKASHTEISDPVNEGDVTVTNTDITIEEVPCVEEVEVEEDDIEDWNPSLDVLYGAGDIVKYDGECFKATEKVWWDAYDGEGPITYNNGTPVVLWQGPEFKDYVAGEVYTNGNGLYLKCLKADMTIPPDGVEFEDYEWLIPPGNMVPDDYSNGVDANYWAIVPCEGNTKLVEVPCPTKSLKVYESTWQQTGELSENTYYFGGPKAKPDPPSPLYIKTFGELHVDLTSSSGDTTYPEFLEGCPTVKVTSEPKESDSQPPTVALLGGNLTEPPKVEVKPTVPIDSVDVNELVADIHTDEELSPNVGKKEFLKESKTCIELDGSPQVTKAPVDVVSEISSASITYETPSGSTSTNTFELTTKELKEESSATYVPVLTQATDCNTKCLTFNVGGRLKLQSKTYEGKKQEITVGTQDVNLNLKGKKLALSRKLQKTLLKTKGFKYNSETATSSYELELSANLYNLKSEVSELSVSIYGMQSQMYESYEGDLSVSVYAYPDTYKAETTEFEFANEKVSICTQPGEYSGKEHELTAEKKRFEVKQEKRTDTISRKYVSFTRPDGHKVTVNPGILKICIDYQRVHTQKQYNTKINFSDKYSFDLTPYETKLYFDKTHKLDIFSSQDYLDFEEAKRLKLIPKEYTFKQYKEDLEYEEKQILTHKKKVRIGSTECQTVNANITDLGTDQIDIWSAKTKPKPPIPDQYLWSTEVSIGNKVSIAQSMYFDWVDVSIGKSFDPLSLKGVSLGNYEYKPAPDPVDMRYTRTDTEYNNYKVDECGEWHHNEITYEDIDVSDNTDVVVYSTQYSKGAPLPVSPIYIETTDVDIIEAETQATNKVVRADYLKVNISEDYDSENDYDDISTTKLSYYGSYDMVYDSDKVAFGYLKKYTSDAIPCETSDKVEITSSTLETATGYNSLKDNFSIPLEIFDDGSEASKEQSEAGPDLDITTIDDSDNSIQDILPSTKVGTASIISSSEVEDLPEWTESTVEYEAPTGTAKQIFVPALDSCPVEGSIRVLYETSAADVTECQFDESAGTLIISQKIKSYEYKIECGVLSKNLGEKDHYLPNITLSAQAIYTESVEVCENGQPVTKNFLTLDQPLSGQSPSGYIFTTSPCP